MFIEYEEPIIKRIAIKYIDKECVGCGRLRVELYDDGSEICEKCNLNQSTKEYEDKSC